MRRVFVGVLMVWLVLGWTSTSAARTRCFAETGFCVSDPILTYWEKNGGLAVFGYPLGVLHDETIEGSWRGPTQWFERDRLEDHGMQGVLAGRLGALARERQGRPWQQGSDAQVAGCRYFDVTGYTVCEPFLSYWQKNGGVMRFGYPITARQTEALGDWRGDVQYFERRRMEWHPEFAGTPYEVLLGRLGAETMTVSSPSCGQLPASMHGLVTVVPFDIACVTAVDQVTAPYQTFQNGVVFYVAQRNEVVWLTTVFPQNSYQRIVSSWTTADPDVYSAGPIAVRQHIGKALTRAGGIPAALGTVLSEATLTPVTVVQFASGALAIQINGSETVYVVGTAPDQTITITTGP